MSDKKTEKEETLGPEHLLPWESGPAASEKGAQKDLLEILDSDLPEMQFEDDDEEPKPKRASGARQDEEDESEEDESELDEEDESESDEEVEDEPLEEEDEDDQSEEEDDESEDDEDSDESSEEEPEYHSLKIDGEDFEVTLQEALDGYSRTQDYTRKRQADVETHKVEMAEVREVRETYARNLEALDLAIQQVSPPERTSEEWDALRAKDVDQFAREFADAQLVKQKREAVKAEWEKEDKKQIEDAEAEMAEHLERERDALWAAVPEWKDENIFDTEQKALRTFAETTFGFTEKDLGGVRDHRLLLLLRDSMLYREGQTKGKEKIRKKVDSAPRLRPGRSGKMKGGNKGIRKQKDLRASQKRLARSGSEQDALAVIHGLLGDDD